jgi:hypothetical protein
MAKQSLIVDDDHGGRGDHLALIRQYQGVDFHSLCIELAKDTVEPDQSVRGSGQFVSLEAGGLGYLSSHKGPESAADCYWPLDQPLGIFFQNGFDIDAAERRKEPEVSGLCCRG